MSAMLSLNNGRLGLSLQPALGACCSSLTYTRPGQVPLHLLRPLPFGSEDPFASGCFVLVPYSNRLFGARLMTRTRGNQAIALNRKTVHHPVHGVGWTKHWTVLETAHHSATLEYLHHADGHWPFAHTCRFTVSLAARSVRFELTLRNLSDDDMPEGLGFHPYLQMEADAVLRFAAHSVWQQDAHGMPTSRSTVAEDARFDFGDFTNAMGTDINHCFAQWTGVAELRRPAHALAIRLAADPGLGHLVVYHPPQQPWICIEPVSHATGAFSLEKLHTCADGLRWLAPQCSARLSMELHVVDLPYEPTTPC